ncbi:Os03g0140300 [Oryza sativa Japonica Group]|uniref:Os03g0140300 protein n=1 Tax=Oryza sativa subsp. japonica TaxID=39947 RepID=A0A0N7KGJ8_ORYSJ|nr:hypothetical protein EE612_015212 [Oryza sativa]BAS82217.1 Os03g0140300 [Oryza sativa Japonica Group]
MSLMYTSASALPAISSSQRKEESKSATDCLSPPPPPPCLDLLSSSALCFAMADATKLSTVRLAAAFLFSCPIPSHLIVFQNDTGMVWRRKIVRSTSSIARAKGTSGRPMSRQPGSTPNTRWHVASSDHRVNTSCRSHVFRASATCARKGRRPFSTLSRLERATKARNRGVVMSIWALFRCRRHRSPSVLKMPPPRTSNMSANTSPLG